MERRWKILLLVSVGNAMSFLDLFIVNIAFPDVARDFPNESLATLSWILNTYTILLAALLVPAGRWADLVGRKRVFLAGLSVFVLASTGCAVAPSVGFLIGARAVQATGAAMMIPSSLGLCLPEFPLNQRTTAVGAWAAVGSVAAAAGPPLGGVLVQASWRWVFLVNLPIGIVLALIAARVLSESKDPTGGKRPDVIGAACLALGVGALVLAIIEGPHWGWASARVIAGFATAAVLLPLVIARSARHAAPVVDLSILRAPSFSVASTAIVFFFAGFAAFLLSSVLYLTEIWHYSILSAGLALAPGPLLAGVSAAAAGRLSDRIGRRLVGIVGALLFAVGAVWLVWQVGARPDYLAEFFPSLILTGVGGGLASPAIITAAIYSVPAARIATGAAVAVMLRQIGGALGVAVLIAILGSGVTTLTLSGFDQTWEFIAVCGFATAVVCLRLRRTPVGASVEDHNGSALLTPIEPRFDRSTL
ncbi:MAG: DHA2 family efflux MFS transporter permease subunit [Solirubrobacterales bacterium]